MDDPVGLVESLGGAGAARTCGLLGVVEARDVGGLQVDLGLAEHHPLGDRLADARALLDPDRGGGPEALDLGRLAEHRQPVRRQRQEAVDRVLDAHALVTDDSKTNLNEVGGE